MQGSLPMSRDGPYCSPYVVQLSQNFLVCLHVGAFSALLAFPDSLQLHWGALELLEAGGTHPVSSSHLIQGSQQETPCLFAVHSFHSIPLLSE